MTPLRRPSPDVRGRIGAVVLAAGSSRRMGVGNKLLVEVEGQPVVRRAAAALVAAGLGPVVVVTGHQGDEVAAAVAGLGVERVHNEEHSLGMARSLAAGVAAVEGRCEAALIALGDMPWIAARTIRAVAEAYAPDDDPPICAPEHDGRLGHPVLWSSRFFSDLRRLHGDVGARELLDSHRERLVRVPVEDPAIHRDIDVPADLVTAAR